MEVTDILIMCLFSFSAGFVDAIVGGGGLIQTPAILILFPQYPVPMLLGTTKIPAFSGTLNATYQYSKRVSMNYKVLAFMCFVAFGASMLGSSSVNLMPREYLRPFMLVLMIGIAIYTFLNKNFGSAEHVEKTDRLRYVYAAALAALIGFYDGFFGPGAGSFLILVFIGLLGMDFLHASAHAKAVNLFTNLASITYFGLKGLIIWKLTVPMAVANFAGGFTGAKLAISKGNKLVRYFFLIVVCGTIIRFAYDLIMQYR
ncbi:hypothetical protein LX64_02031 [Chitinophaga skermanii]|uniref:Probable membrane transporter protein n=1 Tax=Chitinophaga skermanii TaxID=331697 RepID=A0A327QU21_9BACT|nr:TSUP family transporter [Chitinophaga skermanii]RAJ06903.1 hypothetical protein LX64_02031 [Chitinophaga skermanii]